MNARSEPTSGHGSLADEGLADLLNRLDDADISALSSILPTLERLLTRKGVVRRLCVDLESNTSRRRRACVHALAHLRALEAASRR